MTRPPIQRFQVPEINRVRDASPLGPPYSETAGLDRIGSIAPRPSRGIEASPFGVGLEMLDRHAYDPAKVIPPMAATGAKWARVQTGWNRTESLKGRYDFAWLDAVVDGLRAGGIAPWFCVSYGNLHYTPGAVWAGVGGVPLYFGDETLAAWRRFVRATARHFRGRVAHWEIWNEPNTAGFWPFDVPDKAADYTRLVGLTAGAIKAEIPDATIIGGSTSGIDLDFTRRAITAGLLPFIDAFSFHPYGQVPEDSATGIRALRALLDRAGSARVRLWQGEWGYPSRLRNEADRTTYRATEHIQAKALARRLLLDRELGLDVIQYFTASDAHDLRIAPEPTRASTGAGGLLDTLRDHAPKRAYFTLQTLAALFDAGTTVGASALLELAATGFRPQLHLTGACVRTFERRGRPLIAYYYPEHPQLDNEARLAYLRLWADPKPDSLVLVDPVFNRVYRVLQVDPHTKEWRKAMLPDMPIADYPLILAAPDAIEDLFEPCAC